MGPETTSELVEKYGDRGAVLARLPREWTLLHDTPWPGRPAATLDHVAIGPSGVFVIVVGDDPAEARSAADAVAGWLPGLPRDHLHGVLVGADHPAPWVEVDGVILCETVDLARLLRSLPSVLTSEEVAGVVGVVYVGLERAERARRAVATSFDPRKPAPAAEGARATGSLGQSLVTDVQAVAEVRRGIRLRRGRHGLGTGDVTS